MMHTLILLLTLQTAQPTAQPLCAAHPERCEMKVTHVASALKPQTAQSTTPPDHAPFVGSVSTITSDNVFPAFILADSINTPLIITCAVSDGLTVKNCKIAEGHTLDEVINYLLTSQRKQYDRDQAEKKAILDAWEKSLRDIESHLAPKLVVPQVKQDAPRPK